MLSPDELKQYSYFAGLSTSALAVLSARMDTLEVEADTPLIRQLTPADYFYFLAQGEVEVSRRNRFGQTAKLAVLSSGAAFGEVALLSCSHRCGSVTTKVRSRLHRLSKRDFDEIIVRESAFEDLLRAKASGYETFGRLKGYQPFALLDPEKVLALTERMVERSCEPGEAIIRQGDKRDFFYVIESGRVAVLKERPGVSPEVVAELGEGQSFGEEAFLRDKRRSATVKALEPTRVLELRESDFNQILGTSFIDYVYAEDLEEEDITQYAFVDARIPPEYEEEHIEGAVSIPIEILRARYGELDPDQPYVTYCTNDSRGTTAAFLLNAQGFHAKALRGGLSAWEGPVATGPSGGIHLPRIG